MNVPTMLDDRTTDDEDCRSAWGATCGTNADILDDIPCRGGDPDLWFAEAPADLERAKELCSGCPVQRACLAAALDRAEPWGVWGGQIFDQGVVIARKRPRGRPRKNAA